MAEAKQAAAAATTALRYAHLGVGVTDLSIATAFYKKFGFEPQRTVGEASVLADSTNLELHLFKLSDERLNKQYGSTTGVNVLMDLPTEKWTGINHMSFDVEYPQDVADYLEQEDGLAVSGTRTFPGMDGIAACFSRDPDRTTLEFQNHSNDKGTRVEIDPTALSGYPIAHVGIRVSDAQRAADFYGQNFGFTNLTSYVPNPDPLKNFHPWIIVTDGGVDINLLVNGNMAGSGPRNALLEDEGGIAPGIAYVAFDVQDVAAAADALKAKGIPVLGEADVAQWGLPEWALLQTAAEGDSPASIFVRDPDNTLIRLQQAPSSS